MLFAHFSLDFWPRSLTQLINSGVIGLVLWSVPVEHPCQTQLKKTQKFHNQFRNKESLLS